MINSANKIPRAYLIHAVAAVVMHELCKEQVWPLYRDGVFASVCIPYTHKNNSSSSSSSK